MSAADEFSEIERLFRPLTRGAAGAFDLLDAARRSSASEDIAERAAIRFYHHEPHRDRERAAAEDRHHGAVNAVARAKRTEIVAFVELLMMNGSGNSYQVSVGTYVATIAADPEIGEESTTVRITACGEVRCWAVLAASSGRFRAMVARVRTGDMRTWGDLKVALEAAYPRMLSVKSE